MRPQKLEQLSNLEEESLSSLFVILSDVQMDKAGVPEKLQRMFEGFEAVLKAAEDRRLPWGIVTNKPGWLTTPLVRALALDGRAGCVISGDTYPERKPHPLPLLHAAAQLERTAAECLYVGDAERDIVAGRAAGMRTVAVRFGYLAVGEDPAAWGPDEIIASPAGLLDFLALDAP